MPIVDGVGYGELTSIKIEHLSKIFAMHLAVTGAVLNKHPYFIQQYRYIDVTAGKGFTPDGNEGSPLVFLSNVESDELRLPYRADLIECNQTNFSELKNNIRRMKTERDWKCDKLYLYNGQYEDVIPKLFRRKNSKEFGLVFVDHSGDMPNFEILQNIAEKRPRMEILIYISATNIKRLHPQTGKYLTDYMDEMGKDYWLIRKPFCWDSHQWTFLLGSGCDIFGDYKKIDFVRLKSKAAQAFFPKLNLSEKQRQEKSQPRLFE